ncbi:hypothetical protein Bca52824_001521 [Brassica carinata]|uniref:Uncharacterized protein n=1 Tax=Brassica carinata TaxID=52824 RepID=A0A8X7WIW8_BRACI|nr:hypothetical protein Bca52824_001521 [Brassica carinata]
MNATTPELRDRLSRLKLSHDDDDLKMRATRGEAGGLKTDTYGGFGEGGHGRIGSYNAEIEVMTEAAMEKASQRLEPVGGTKAARYFSRFDPDLT